MPSEPLLLQRTAAAEEIQPGKQPAVGASTCKKQLDGEKIVPNVNVFQFFQAVSAVPSDYSLPGGLIKAVNTPKSFQGCPYDSSVLKKIYANVHRCHYLGDLAAEAPASAEERLLMAGVALKVKYIQALKLTGSALKPRSPADGSHPPHPSARISLETTSHIFQEP